MGADIAFGQRAENGVGNGVQQDVGVGMADEPPVVRNVHAAEPDMVAVAEGVHIEPLAGAQSGV